MEVAVSPVHAEALHGHPVGPRADPLRAPGRSAGPSDGLVEPRPRVEDFTAVEEYLRAYLQAEGFKAVYPRAYERWSEASTMLWRADSRESLLRVGNGAHGAIREFAGVLSGAPLAAGADSTATQARLSATIGTRSSELADSRREFLDGLFDYWRTLFTLVQRHEGAPAVGECLRWEDARRVVVLTALVMVEVDRSLDSSVPGG
jgi:hypothetical protein